MKAWSSARSLRDAAFEARFVDPLTSTAAIKALRAAAEGARTASTHQDLAEASASLAAAMQDIGIGKWPGFLRDASDRAAAKESANANVVVAQLSTPGKATDASPNRGAAAQTGPDLSDFRKRFETATETAYKKYSNDCSHYLQTFLKSMGFADTPYRTANTFMEFVQRPDSGWKKVTDEEAVRLAAEGNVVVAGLAAPGGNGHVAVVGPQMIPSSLTRGHPLSPQIYSGSIGGWAGSRSQGEHTVADGWVPRDRDKVNFYVKQ